jgi:tagatose 6-phosphate kinase
VPFPILCPPESRPLAQKLIIMNPPAILTVTPNAAQDRVYLIDDFALGRVHRPTQLWTFAGGKGVNVARAFSRLGGSAVCTGFLAGTVGAHARAQLAAEGLVDEFVGVEGESRLCMQFCDTINERITEVNEPGPPVRPQDVDTVTERIRRIAPGVQAVALCGRNVLGAPDSAYAVWLRAAKDGGAMTILDTSGGALREGLLAGLDVLKVNIAELAEVLGLRAPVPEDLPGILRSRAADLPPTVVITCGPRGVWGLAGGRVLHGSCPATAFRSAVGSGDAFTGGFLWSRLTGGAFEDQIRWGVAAAAANLETFCACDITPDAVASALTRARVEGPR